MEHDVRILLRDVQRAHGVCDCAAVYRHREGCHIVIPGRNCSGFWHNKVIVLLFHELEQMNAMKCFLNSYCKTDIETFGRSLRRARRSSVVYPSMPAAMWCAREVKTPLRSLCGPCKPVVFWRYFNIFPEFLKFCHRQEPIFLRLFKDSQRTWSPGERRFVRQFWRQSAAGQLILGPNSARVGHFQEQIAAGNDPDQRRRYFSIAERNLIHKRSVLSLMLAKHPKRFVSR